MILARAALAAAAISGRRHCGRGRCSDRVSRAGVDRLVFPFRDSVYFFWNMAALMDDVEVFFW
jgi:hypothetical protein